MNEYIKFSSVSAAQKARMMLMRQGVRSMVGKNPSPKKSEGCSFALFVDDAQAASMGKYNIPGLM